MFLAEHFFRRTKKKMDEGKPAEPEDPASWSSYLEKIALISMIDDCWSFVDGQSLVARWFGYGSSHSGLGHTTRHCNSKIHSKKS